MSISVRDISWLAGILEGEGTFSLKTGSISVELSSTDRDVVGHAASLLGAKKVNGPYNTGISPKTGRAYKPQWRAQIHGRHAAEWMMTVYMLLGERRQDKVRECLSFWKKQLPWRGHRVECKRGHPLSGGNLLINKKGQRNCRKCENVRQLAAYHSKTRHLGANQRLPLCEGAK